MDMKATTEPAVDTSGDLSKPTAAQQANAVAEQIVLGIRNIGKRFPFNLLILANRREQFGALRKKCIDHQKELLPHLKLREQSSAILEIQESILEDEAQFNHLLGWEIFKATVSLGIISSLFAIPVYVLVKIYAVEDDTLLYIFLGVVGVVVNLIVTALQSSDDSSLGRVWRMLLRTFLQLILTLLVLAALRMIGGAIFLKGSSPVDPNTVNQVIWYSVAFACGYSVQIILTILQRVEDRARKIVEVI